MVKKPIKHVYFDSKMNNRTIKEPEVILQSIIGFNHDEFRQIILDELEYLGISKEDLARNCYIGLDRMKGILIHKSKFSHSEITEITKRLSLT